MTKAQANDGAKAAAAMQTPTDKCPCKVVLPHAHAIGQPAGAEGRAGHRQVEGGDKKAHLGARETELVLVKRRQRVDAVLRRRADDMGGR